jgi:hypothetical protein
MDTPTLYLHIGTNKTGTSAIQRFFNQHRDALRQHGLLYPVTGCSGNAHYAFSALLGFDHSKPRPIDTSAPALCDMRSKLEREIENSSCSHVLMSSEDFVLPRAVTPVRNFLKDFNVRVVVYLRRHDGWWESAYNQAVKMVAEPPWGRGFDRYLRYQRMRNPKYGNYRALLNRWDEVFGSDNIIVRPYEKQQNAPNVAVDLLHAIGRGGIAQQMDVQPGSVNSSLHGDTVHLIDAFQRARIDPELRRRLIEYAIATAPAGVTQSLVEPDIRRRLVEENMQDYAYIARKYLGRKDGRMFLEPLPDPDEPWIARPRPTPSAIVEATVQALTDAKSDKNVRSVA